MFIMFTSYFKLRKYYRHHVDYGLPFARSQDARLKTMLELSSLKPNDKVIDLGAGDGKVVIAFAKAGAIACGIEIDETLADLATYNIIKNKLKNEAFVSKGDFWDEPIGTL